MAEPRRVEIVKNGASLWTTEDQVVRFERRGWSRAGAPITPSRSADLLAAVAVARGRTTPATQGQPTDLRTAVEAARAAAPPDATPPVNDTIAAIRAARENQ